MVEKGYKQTEVGVIPEDWNSVQIKDIACVKGGSTPKTSISKYWDGHINWFTPTEVGEHKYLYFSNRKITEVGLKDCSATILPIGTILMTTRAGIGDLGILKNEASTNQGFQSLICNNNINNEYLYYLMQTKKNDLLRNASGSTFLEISPSKVKSILIPLPPLPEQTAIAEALSDMDALIAQTEKLIEKKKAIKQGVMQQLLTPKEGWCKVKIKDIAKVGRGRVISQNEIFKSINNKYPVYSSQTTNNGIMGYIDTFDFNGEYITWTTDGEKAGTVFYRNGEFNCTNVCGTIKLKEGNARFIHYILSNEAPKYVSRNLANPKLMNEPMKNIEIIIPKDISEQGLISDLIQTIEAEIFIIESKFQKLKHQKMGMMQALLTGKIRLI